jgi:hypothetical protein
MDTLDLITDHQTPVSFDQVARTAAAVEARGIHVEIVDTGSQALARLQTLIPAGANVMTGGSRTLQQIGLDDLLIAGTHPWVNFKAQILAETDPAKQQALRLQSIMTEYFLGSLQAITHDGEIVFASAGGSQLASYAFSSPNLIWVAGAQKIVPTLEAALARIREYALPREDERMKSLGYPGSFIGKLLIFEREPAQLNRKVTLILVNEALGV